METLEVQPELESANNLVTAEIAVDGAFATGGQGVLTYVVPEALRPRVSRGQLVWVPLRNQMVLGICLALGANDALATLKPISTLVEPEFYLNEEQLDTVEWLARETACSLFAAVEPFLPPGVSHRAVEYLSLTAPGLETDFTALTPVQRRLAELLKVRGEVSLEVARTTLEAKLTTVIPKLEAAGIVERIVRVADAAPRPKHERSVCLVVADRPGGETSPKQQRVIDFMAQRSRLAPENADRYVPVKFVMERTGVDRATLAALVQTGVLLERVTNSRDTPVISGEPRPAPPLTVVQATAWSAIEASLERHDPTPLLIHGVTGSGKTELYLRAVGWCLRRGLASIILVPEIALASQVVRRFHARFPGHVAVLHSALPDRERYATWQAVAAGELKVVVGPRSALFAPVERLGVIVLDEEHEAAFKQEGEPRYHARRLAEQIAAREGCSILLGSATPSVETRWRSESGEARLISLPQRVGQRKDGEANAGPLELPPIEIVDMRLELHRGRPGLISQPLHDLIASTLAAHEQTMLFLNRRGTSTVVVCRSCGTAIGCPNCDIPLVYHKDRQSMLCHRCNHRERPRDHCPTCSGGLNYFGAGTQRVEEEVKALFPQARVARWDQDSVRKRGSHERILQAVERREIDVVVGTQMIAKGLDLPYVTAIGVIHADTLLNLPDFRSSERTFQLLTQVAGRAGRRTSGSHVIMQSYSPQHYAIQAAARHDYEAFYREEIEFRRVHRYPPFTRLARYFFRHAKEEVCAAESEEMARMVARHARTRRVTVDIIGPTPAFASRMRGLHQWNFVLRADSAEFDRLLGGLPVRAGWAIDVDPQSLL